MLEGLTKVGESPTERRVYSDQLKEFEAKVGQGGLLGEGIANWIEKKLSTGIY